MILMILKVYLGVKGSVYDSSGKNGTRGRGLVGFVHNAFLLAIPQVATVYRSLLYKVASLFYTWWIRGHARYLIIRNTDYKALL